MVHFLSEENRHKSVPGHAATHWPSIGYGKVKRPLIILIAIASFAVYFNCLKNEFVWDDKILIAGNERVQDWRYLGENFRTHLYHRTGSASNFYRPVLKLSFMLDYSIWKDSVLGWHLTNVVLHTVNALLIFFIFGMIFKDQLASFLASIIFAVHPVFTSAVAYISGRGDPLALFFMLVSFLFFIESRRALSVMFFILALLTKETAIVLPLLLFAYQKIEIASEKVWEKGPDPFLAKRGQAPFFPYVLICIIYGALRLTVFNFPFVPTLTGGSTLILRLLTMAKIVFMYLGLLVLPLGLHMERNVPYVTSFSEGPVILSVLALAVSGYFIWRKICRKEKYIFFGIMWFFIALLPLSNIKPLNMSMAEHWLYVPAIGLFASCGILAARLIGKGPPRNLVAWAVISGFVLFFSYNTVLQNRVWKDEKTLFTNLLNHVPDSYMAHTSMGNIYRREGKTGLAIAEYKKALEILPHHVPAHLGLSQQYLDLGRLEEAAWHCKRASAYFPILAEPHYRLAIIYEYNKQMTRYGPGFRREESVAEYKKALKLDPEHKEARHNLNVVLMKK